MSTTTGEGWKYLTTLCGVPPAPAAVDASCNFASFSYQVTAGGACYRLADMGRSRVAAPLPGGALGVEVTLSGGDPCGGASRSTRVRLRCGEAGDGGAPPVFVEEPACTYSVEVVHPAGCPLSCGRDAAGAVCGGRGTCTAGSSGVGAACVCAPGFGGPRCEAGVSSAALDGGDGGGGSDGGGGADRGDAPAPAAAPATLRGRGAIIAAGAAVLFFGSFYLLRARGCGGVAAVAGPGERPPLPPPAALPRRALLRRLHELLTAPLPTASELSFAWWVNTWVRIAATAGAMAVLAMASGSVMPLVARPGARIKAVDALVVAEESRSAGARGGGGGGSGGGGSGGGGSGGGGSGSRLAPCYANPALANCRRWLDEVLPSERIDIVLFGNELWGQFPLVGYGGIEASVETMAGALHEMGVPFWVVTPKRVTRPPPLYPYDVMETSDNPSGAGGYVPRYVAEGLAILRARGNAGGDNVTLVDGAHGAHWRRRRSAPDAPGAPRPLVVWGQSDWSQSFAEAALVEITTHHDGGGPIAGWDRRLPNVGHRFLSKDQRSRWVAEGDVRAARAARARPTPFFSPGPPPTPPPAHRRPSTLRARASSRTGSPRSTLGCARTGATTCGLRRCTGGGRPRVSTSSWRWRGGTRSCALWPTARAAKRASSRRWRISCGAW